MHVATLQERLSGARKTAGLSQRQLAKLAGVSSAYIANVERGLFGIGAKKCLKIASVLGVPPEWLLLGQGDEPSERTIRRASRAAEKGAA